MHAAACLQDDLARCRQDHERSRAECGAAQAGQAATEQAAAAARAEAERAAAAGPGPPGAFKRPQHFQ